VVLSDGRSIPATILERTVDKPTALLELDFTQEPGSIPAGIEYGDINALKLGQSILTLSGVSQLNVATGIIASLNETTSEVTTTGEDGKPATTTVSVLKSINTNINPAGIEKGGPLMNIFGDVIGISTLDSRVVGQSSFTPMQVVQNQLALIAEERVTAATKTE
jgi:S1-C subfamily serine protease